MRTLRLLLIVLLVISALFGETLQKSELNPEYVKYLDDLQNNRIKTTTASGYSLGYIPPPVKLNTELKNSFLRKTVAFDSRYDLRDYSLVTVAKNQAGCGSCWTFATMGSVESRWLKLGEGTHDLSENNMKNGHDYEWAPCDGGNPYISTSYFTRGLGPISEADDPYADYEDGYTSGLSPQAYIGDAKYLPNNADAIKQAILDYGALYTNMRWEDQYYNSANNTYYCDAPTDSSTNHGVLLVGWDDTKSTAGGTGAWIIKNSWGTSWGENGFFYISYNDTKVNSSVACWPTKYDYTSDTKIGQYDEFGWVNNWGFGDGNDYGLMKYTPENETISMVGTWAVSAGTYLKVEIYDDFNGYSLTNKLAESNTTTCDYAGYYSLPLTSPLTLTANNDVYIKVMFNTGTSYPIPAEQYSEGYAVPTIDYGRYWISSNGSSNSWYSADDYDFDINIKVYSTYATQSVSAAFTASTTSGNAPLTVYFTDQSTGSPSTWYWNFGDGSTSTLQNPSHTYSYGGTYSVSLTVGNGSSSDTETKTNYISVAGGTAITSTTTGGNWSEASTWVGSVVPTASDNVIINGNVNVNTNTQCKSLTINSGKILQNGTYFYEITANENLINNGTIQNSPSGYNLTVYVLGNVMNNGVIQNSKFYMNGSANQTLSMSSTAEFKDLAFYNTTVERSLIAGSDLRFNNCTISSYDGKLVLPQYSGYGIEFTGGYITTTNIEANGNTLSSTKGHYYYSSNSVDDGVFNDTTIVYSSNFELTGDVVNNGTIQNGSYFYAMYINGNLTNNGTIINSLSGYNLTTYLSGNLMNNGKISCANFHFNGTSQQTVTFDNDATFESCYIYEDTEGNNIIVGSDITIVDCITNFQNVGNLVIPVNSGHTINFQGGYTTNINIVANGNPLNSTDGHYFYSTLSISDPIFEGTTICYSNGMNVTGEVVNNGYFQNGSYFYTVNIDGNLTNNGIFRDSPDGYTLDMYISGNLTNNGSILNENLFFDGTTDQTLTMSASAIINDVEITDQYAVSKVVAGSSLRFDNVIWQATEGQSQGALELPAQTNFGVTFTGGYLTGATINAHGNDVKLTKGAYFYTYMNVYDPVYYGTIICGSSSITSYGDVVVEDTLQNGSYFYKMIVDGKLTNNGIIRNSPSGYHLSLDIDGDLVNNGDLDIYTIAMLSANNQSIELINGKQIDSPTNLHSNKGSSGFQWYHDGVAMDGKTSDYITFDPLTANHYGTYYTTTNEGNSQTFTISGANIIVVPDIMTATYGPPSEANTWTKYTIPMTYESFGETEEIFNEAMKQISMIRIRTEMADGTDYGSVDNVKLGDAYTAYFSTGTEGWTVMGDGTMSWVASGGVQGGYITIADWASGDWHWAVAPSEWTGDLSAMIGDNFEFYIKTDRPDYAAVVEFHTGDANRIVMTANKMNLVPGESTVVSVSLDPVPSASTTVTLSSSNTSYLTVPTSVTVPAGVSLVTFTAQAAASISTGGTSVVSASASGYSTARLTFSVSDANNTTLAGTVTDATTGQPLGGAVIQVAGQTATSASDGTYLIQNVPAGALTAEFIGTPTSGNAPLSVQFTDYSSNNTQTVSSTKDGYINYVNRQVQIVENQTNTLDISMSPVLMEGAIRFVLSWDDDPRDIDSYLHTPEIEGEDYYVYYNNKGSTESAPYAVLDVDDTDGYGPETITIHQVKTGKYKYYIQKYSGNQYLSESNAVVHIYNSTGLLNTVHIPASGTGNYWEVCELDGASKNITIINQIRDDAPATVASKMLACAPKVSVPKDAATLAFTYEWDFGDGQTSTLANPQHLYTNPGYYTVTLKVTDGDNSSTEIKEDYINVIQSVATVDTLLWESFEGTVSGWLVYDNDGDNNKWATYSEEAPYDTVAHSGEIGLGIRYNSAGNDDWIVTPQIYIPENGEIEFSVWAHSHSATYAEDFNVKLSTTSDQTADFQTTLQSVVAAPLAWTKYSYDLTNYHGQNIYLALQCVSVDKWYLWADDFLVTATSYTDVEEEPEVIPTTFALHQNYPNPFNPTTNIRYDLPMNNKVNLAIYNIRGELVEQLVSEFQNAGEHKVTWHADNQPTGVYFVKITAGNFVAVKKIMFMK